MQIHTLYGRPSRPEEEDAIQWMVVQWGAMPAVENMVCGGMNKRGIESVPVSAGGEE